MHRDSTNWALNKTKHQEKQKTGMRLGGDKEGKVWQEAGGENRQDQKPIHIQRS